ncbi:hypothetical protein VSVS12_04201 [Vibrio scophthalmi]|uniref:hypothetical protein n=1 Tax=Vibrio scophthalmi TaxID=45658 RepID=UPI0008097AE4|nr:hypothetical protein [Vibrio scophthalmi]ANS87901.1 hypothetical protein VSVS12_04201 [Vibrio scophthalmi]
MARYTSLAQLPRFESVNDAQEENENRINTLRRVGGTEYNRIADLLSDCLKGERTCNSLACKLCNRTFRLRRVDDLVAKIRSEKGSWWIVTIIDYSSAFTSEELNSFDVSKSKDCLRKRLKRAGFEGVIVGSFEVDFHDICGLWLPHYHLLCRNTKQNRQAKNELQAMLARQQPSHIKAGRTPKPLMFQRLKQRYTQVSYIYKLVFNRVCDYDDSITKKAKTKKRRLNDVMFCQSLLWMDRIGRRRVLFSFGERGW